MKGKGTGYEAKMLLAILFFLAFIMFISTMINQTNIPVSPYSNSTTGAGVTGTGIGGTPIVDFGVFAASLTAVSGTCVAVGGLACGIGLGIFAVVNAIFFMSSNNMLWIIFVPLGVVVTYLIARLARGGG
jgi:hypothetical protein